ncbi:MAG: ACP S-malonyltransferase [Patescibacteria group bacterium]|nr:ACP S-malonyltransferase [Patescibacteria group bacterium]
MSFKEGDPSLTESPEAEPIGNKQAEVFPGQGSLKVPFAQDFWESFDAAKRVFEEADDFLGYSISSICFNGPEDELIQKHAQLARFVGSWAVLEALREQGKLDDPDFVAGHSLGEFTALARAGMGFKDGLRLVEKRTTLMHEFRSEDGIMKAIIGGNEEEIQVACEEIMGSNGFGYVGIANRNSKLQTVISGNRRAVEEASERIKERKIARKIIDLPVSDAFHTPLMREANREFRKVIELTDFSSVRIPVSLNATGEIYRPGIDPVEKLVDALSRQMEEPVLFESQTRKLIQDGAGHFVEMGGNVISGIVGNIDKRVKTTSINEPKDILDFAV